MDNEKLKNLEINPEQLSSNCERLGYKISEPALRVMTRKGLIQKPYSGHRTVNERGRFTYYHQGAHIEAITAHLLKWGIFPTILQTKDQDKKILKKMDEQQIRTARIDFIMHLSNGVDPTATQIGECNFMKKYIEFMYVTKKDLEWIASIKKTPLINLNNIERNHLESFNQDKAKMLIFPLEKSLDDYEHNEQEARIIISNQRRCLYQMIFVRLACRDILLPSLHNFNEGGDK